MQEAFRRFDTDDDSKGEIPSSDVLVAMRALGVEPSKEDLREMFESVNKDSGSKITADDFLVMMTNKMKASMNPSEIAKSFLVCQSGDVPTAQGTLDFEQLKKLTAAIGEDIDDEELRRMLKSAGATDDKGTITFAQFEKVVSEAGGN